MAKRCPVDNSQVLEEIQNLRREMNERFEDISPYIEFLKDANAARKALAWIFGGVMAIVGLYLMLKQLFPTLPPNVH